MPRGRLPGMACAAMMAFGLAWAGPGRTQDELLLGGILPTDGAALAAWGFSGAWRYPVGGARDVTAGAEGVPPYKVSRNVGGQSGRGHGGADLVNGRSGDPVRAAGDGRVVVADDSGWNGGFGAVIVLAHRLPEGGLAYSVYAHLIPTSLGVRVGEDVAAGTTLGRVGRSGRVTTAHLHFEVRRPASPGERWERARPVDPLAWVAARLVGPEEVGAAGRLLGWAEYGALLPAGLPAEAPLTRADGWRLLARAARLPGYELPADPAGTRAALVEQGLLPPDSPLEPGGLAAWGELADGLQRAARLGFRLSAPPITPAELEELCTGRLGIAHPAAAGSAVSTLGRAVRALDACLLTAAARGAPPPATPPGS